MGTTRDWLLFFHILAVVVAFAPTVAHAILFTSAEREGPEAVRRTAAFAARNDQRLYGPALVLVGVFGVALVTETAWLDFDQSWVASGILLWLILIGVLFGLLIPAQRRVAEGDTDAHKLVKIGGGAMILLFLSALHLMVFQPGM